MKIGMITDSLGELSFDALLDSAAVRRQFAASLADHGIALSALYCSGNPVHPGEHGSRHREITHKTIALAGLMGVERVVMMSGCPGGPGDANANWVTTCWPPEMATILAYQWDDVLIPFWRDLAAYANAHGVTKLCPELHAHQNVYSVDTFFRLRDAVGDTVGVNFDPSHLMWMGADPLAAIAALGDSIYHVHAKDTRIEAPALARDGRIEIRPAEDVAHRAWSYVTLGHGHDETWWRR